MVLIAAKGAVVALSAYPRLRPGSGRVGGKADGLPSGAVPPIRLLIPAA